MRRCDLEGTQCVLWLSCVVHIQRKPGEGDVVDEVTTARREEGGNRSSRALDGGGIFARTHHDLATGVFGGDESFTERPFTSWDFDHLDSGINQRGLQGVRDVITPCSRGDR